MGPLRCLVSCLLVCAASAGDRVPGEDASNPAPSAALEAIFTRTEQRLNGIRTLQADFVEEKELAIFKEKVMLRGTLSLQKPDLFAWHVLEPLRYAMVMKGTRMRQWDEDTNKVQETNLNKTPAFQAAVTQMTQWFSGSYRTLQKTYSITLESERPLAMEFLPREGNEVRNVIKRIVVTWMPEEQYIQEIRVEEKSGDRTRLSFSRIRLNEPVDETAWDVTAHVR